MKSPHKPSKHLRIDAGALRRLRRFCNQRGLVMSKIATRAILDYIERVSAADADALTSTTAVAREDAAEFHRSF